MTISSRSLLAPGVALIAAGAVALGPAIVAPSALTAAPPTIQIPAVQIQNIQLAGVGRDFYVNVVQPAVDNVLGVVTNAIGVIPIIGDPIANQIDIQATFVRNLVQPTVFYLSDLVANIWAFPELTVAYALNLLWAPANWVNDELNFFGLPDLPIPDPPPLAATGARSAATVAGRASTGAKPKPRAPRAAATASRGTAKAAGAKAAVRKAAKPARAVAAAR